MLRGRMILDQRPFNSTASIPTARRQGGQRVGFVAFVVWLVGVVVPGMVWLGRTGCERERPSSVEPIAAQWSVRHVLPMGHPLSTAVATHLALRGPIPGLDAQILMVGSAPTLHARLTAAGWSVTQLENSPDSDDHTGHAAVPSLDVRDGRQARVWSGVYRVSDFADASATVMETVLLAALVRGDPVAPYVPVGCSPRAVPPPTTVAALLRPVFTSP